MTTTAFILGLTAFLILLGLGFWQLMRFQQRKWFEFETKIAANDQTIQVLTQWLQGMRQSLDHQTHTLSQQFEATNQVLGSRLDNTARIMNSVSVELGQMQEIGRQIQRFQDFLQAPKLRGNIGEQVLTDLLEQALPRENFQLQYRFQKGTIVDAVIFTDKGKIPIDAKFPIEAYRHFQAARTDDARKKSAREFVADVKRYLDQVSHKYILPEEGTVDFSLIYIPSEIIYYEILQQSESLALYAQQRRVLLVSPNSFYYFLKIILMALEGKRLELAGRQILNVLAGLRQDSQRLAEQLRILTTHFVNAKNGLDRVNHEAAQLMHQLEATKYLNVTPAPPESSAPSDPASVKA